MKEELAKLQGTWNIVALEVEGATMGSSTFSGSQIIVEGNTFTTVSMGATYKGKLKVDTTKSPKTLDLAFEEGPEKGNKSLAIYEIEVDTWKICLTITGKVRPTAFATKPASGLALETLKRSTGTGTSKGVSRSASSDARTGAGSGASTGASVGASVGTSVGTRDLLLKEIALLEGEWSAISGERDGQTLPENFTKYGKRVAEGNETTVSFGGQVFLKAAYTLGPSSNPRTIDYILTAGDNQGEAQLGIYKLDGDKATFCFAAPGGPRPREFSTKTGGGATLVVWKKAKK